MAALFYQNFINFTAAILLFLGYLPIVLWNIHCVHYVLRRYVVRDHVHGSVYGCYAETHVRHRFLRHSYLHARPIQCMLCQPSLSRVFCLTQTADFHIFWQTFPVCKPHSSVVTTFILFIFFYFVTRALISSVRMFNARLTRVLFLGTLDKYFYVIRAAGRNQIMNIT